MVATPVPEVRVLLSTLAQTAITPPALEVRSRWDVTAILAASGLFIVACLLTGVTPPSDDEFYYWCWAEHLQWSYYDHPLMSALMIRVSGELFGHSLFALRLPACLATAITFGVSVHLMRPRLLAPILALTPLFSLGAVIVTPDTPLILFWSLYLLWMVKLHEKLPNNATWKDWLIGGVLLGCGTLGKYTMALAVPAGFVSMLLLGHWRQWLLGYIAHGLVSFLTSLPILVFNIQHDFAPILYQWNHAMNSTAGGWKSFGDFLGIQVLLFGTMPVCLLPWVLKNWRTLTAEPRLRACLALYAVPFVFFLYKATKGHLEGNWALVSYIAFWPLAAVWMESVRGSKLWRVLGWSGFIPPLAAVTFATVHLITPLPFLTPINDRITRQQVKYELAGEIAAVWRAQPERLPLFAETYQWVALLRFHGIDAKQIDGLSRRSHFTQKPEVPGDYQHCFVLWEGGVPAAVRPPLQEPEKIAAFPLTVRGLTMTTFDLWRVERKRDE